MIDCISPNVWPVPDVINLTDFYRLQSQGCSCTSIQALNNITRLSCDPFPFVHPWWVQLFYIFIFILIIALAAGGNLTVIWIVLAHARMRTVTNYFLLNLAIADASISLFNVCFSFTFNFYYTWFFGEYYCFFNNFMGIMPTCASSTTLMAMSWDRYLAIVHPLRLRLSRTATLAIILGIWLFAISCGFPMLLFSKEESHFFLKNDSTIFESKICRSDDWPDGRTEDSSMFAIYNWIILVITYILPMIVLSYTYARIAHELWGSETIGDHRQEETIKAKKKVVKMLSAVVAVFMICWLPYHLYFTVLMRVLTEITPIEALYIYLNIYWLAMTSPAWPPFIYCWMNSKYRSGFKYVFRWLPCVHMSAQQYAESGLLAPSGRHGSRPNATLNSAAASRRTSHMSAFGQYPSVKYQRPSTASDFHDSTVSIKNREVNSCYSAIETDSLAVPGTMPPHSTSGRGSSGSSNYSSGSDI